jgi:hypothetical protein
MTKKSHNSHGQVAVPQGTRPVVGQSVPAAKTALAANIINIDDRKTTEIILILLKD